MQILFFLTVLPPIHIVVFHSDASHRVKSAVITRRKTGTIRVKVTLLLVKGRTVLLLAAAAANIDSGCYQSQQRSLLTCSHSTRTLR